MNKAVKMGLLEFDGGNPIMFFSVDGNGKLPGFDNQGIAASSIRPKVKNPVGLNYIVTG